MARENLITAIRTTRANLDAQATANNLNQGEQYWITDEKLLAVGNGASTYTVVGAGGSGSGGSSSRFRGAYGSNYTNKIVAFADGIPADWVFSNPPVIVDDADNASGTTKALSFATVNPNYGSQNATFQTKADGSFNQLVIRYKVETEFNYDFFKVYVDNVEAYSDSGVNAYKTATINLASGPHTIKLEVFCDGEATAGFNNVHFSRLSIPVEVASEPYAYGDTVTYNEQTWFNTVAGTTQTPGTGTDWRALGGVTYTAGTGLTLASGQFAADTNVLAVRASPELTGTPTAPTAPASDNSNQLATTAFVTLAVSNGGGSGGVSLSSNNTWTGTNTFSAAVSLNAATNATTQAAGNNSTLVATTAFVTTANASKANLASPAFTGTPTAPTAAVGTNTTQVATMAAVQAASQANGYGYTIQSGNIYTTPGPRGTMTISPDTIYLVPFHLSYAIALFNMSVNVTTGGSGAARMGLYTFSQTSGGTRSFTRIVNSGSNTVSLVNAGVQTLSLSSPSNLSPGKYWIAIQASGSATVTTLSSANGQFCDTIGTSDASQAFGSGFAGFSISQPYTSGLVASYSSTMTPLAQVPLLGLRNV